MDNQYWLQRWQEQKTEFDQTKPNPYLCEYFSSLKLAPGAKIFVPLSGKSIDMLWLLEQGHPILGIDLSATACEAFFKSYDIAYTVTQQGEFTAYSGENICLLAGDYFSLSADDLTGVSAVYDRACLIALPEATRQRYAEHMLNILPANCSILLISTTYPQEQMPGPPYSVSSKEVKRLFAEMNVNVLYDEPANRLPDHLQAKGLCSASEQIYLITNN